MKFTGDDLLNKLLQDTHKSLKVDYWSWVKDTLKETSIVSKSKQATFDATFSNVSCLQGWNQHWNQTMKVAAWVAPENPPKQTQTTTIY